MVFTDATWKYFSFAPFRVRAAMAEAQAFTPFAYEDEPFSKAYEAMELRWIKRHSRRAVAKTLRIDRDKIKELEQRFVKHGTIGLLPELSRVNVDPQLGD